MSCTLLNESDNVQSFVSILILINLPHGLCRICLACFFLCCLVSFKMQLFNLCKESKLLIKIGVKGQWTVRNKPYGNLTQVVGEQWQKGLPIEHQKETLRAAG